MFSSLIHADAAVETSQENGESSHPGTSSHFKFIFLNALNLHAVMNPVPFYKNTLVTSYVKWMQTKALFLTQIWIQNGSGLWVASCS